MVFDPSVGGCVRLEPGKTAYYSFITAALFFVPVGVMIVAYAVIMWKVWSTQVPGENPAYHAVHSKSKAKVQSSSTLSPSSRNYTINFALVTVNANCEQSWCFFAIVMTDQYYLHVLFGITDH